MASTTSEGTDTDTSADDGPTDTGELCDEVPVSPDVVEEHVVLLDDCGLAPTCDPISYIIDPAGGVQCARDHHATGEPGLVEVNYFYDGTDGSEGPYEQEVFFFTPDRRVIRQSRFRMGDGLDSCRPWAAWGPQEECGIVNYFDPDANLVDCQEVEDHTCEELAELYDADPLPAVPCSDRAEDTCNGPISLEEYCSWRAELATYPADSCEPVAPLGSCIQNTYGDPPPQCDLPPLCSGADADSFVYRENDDGTVDIMQGYGCWDYDGFERCEWNAAGDTLVAGPPACDCACPGA